MLEDQPLDLSVRVGDFAEYAREEEDREREVEGQHRDRKEIEDCDNAGIRLRELSSGEYQVEDRTCSEDSDDSCSDNHHKESGAGSRSRTRPPGTKPYKKNLMRRYRESNFENYEGCDFGGEIVEILKSC